jgi:hypothetical protein
MAEIKTARTSAVATPVSARLGSSVADVSFRSCLGVWLFQCSAGAGQRRQRERVQPSRRSQSGAQIGMAALGDQPVD